MHVEERRKRERKTNLRLLLPIPLSTYTRRKRRREGGRAKNRLGSRPAFLPSSSSDPFSSLLSSLGPTHPPAQTGRPPPPPLPQTPTILAPPTCLLLFFLAQPASLSLIRDRQKTGEGETQHYYVRRYKRVGKEERERGGGRWPNTIRLLFYFSSSLCP